MSSRNKTIAEILHMASMPVVSEQSFAVVARVDCLYQPSGWFYVTCYRCSKKIQAIGGLFVCNICDTVCRYPMMRYSIQLCATDSSGKIILTIFNRQAEKLLDSTANKFYNRLPADQFPEPLNDLPGRFYSFRIRLPDYNNVDPDFHTYRVIGMSEVESPPGFESCGGFEEQVGASNKLFVPDCSCPSKAVESAESTSKGAANLGVPTPEKECSTKRRKIG